MIFSNVGTRRLSAIAATLSVVFLAGCATAYRSGTPEAIVKEKATARWQAMIDGDFATAYKFTPPSYQALTTADRYRNRFGGAANWIDAKVISVECEPDRCEVALTVKAYLPTITYVREPASTTVREVWIKESGDWWLYQRM